MTDVKVTIYTILTDDLGKRKVFARCVPHQLNVPPHKTKKVNEFLMKKQICVMDYPPYSPDLSPCDYFLFPKLKNVMKGAFYDEKKKPSLKSLWINWLIVPNVVLSLMEPILNK